MVFTALFNNARTAARRSHGGIAPSPLAVVDIFSGRGFGYYVNVRLMQCSALLFSTLSKSISPLYGSKMATTNTTANIITTTRGLKTHSGSKKRFKKLRSGLFERGKPGKNHLNTGNSGGSIRRGRRSHYATPAQSYHLRHLMPF